MQTVTPSSVASVAPPAVGVAPAQPVRALVARVPAQPAGLAQLAIPSLVGNIAEPLMWLVALATAWGPGGAGERGGAAGDTKVPYILFLASGSICMSAMNAPALRRCTRPSRACMCKDLGRHHERAGEAWTTWCWPRCCGRRSRRYSP